jgi:secreted trypsin-like serine protease
VSAAVIDENFDCSRDDYTLFTDVTYFTSWIKEIMEKYSSN